MDNKDDLDIMQWMITVERRLERHEAYLKLLTSITLMLLGGMVGLWLKLIVG